MTKEYGRKPYLAKDYNEMSRRITDKQINDMYLLRQSELKKPYMNANYEEMEQYYSPPSPIYPPDNPYPPILFTYPMPGSDPTVPTPPITTGYDPCPTYINIIAPTTTIGVGETMQLSVVWHNPLAVFTFRISSGGGDIDENTGLYTAPSTNPNCDLNPTIEVLCNGNVVGEVTIGVNELVGFDVGRKATETAPGTCAGPVGGRYGWLHKLAYTNQVTCAGVENTVVSCDQSIGEGSATCLAAEAQTYITILLCLLVSSIGVWEDRRTPTQKAAGCCPGQLAGL